MIYAYSQHVLKLQPTSSPAWNLALPTTNINLCFQGPLVLFAFTWGASPTNSYFDAPDVMERAYELVQDNLLPTLKIWEKMRSSSGGRRLSMNDFFRTANRVAGEMRVVFSSFGVWCFFWPNWAEHANGCPFLKGTDWHPFCLGRGAGWGSEGGGWSLRGSSPRSVCAYLQKQFTASCSPRLFFVFRDTSFQLLGHKG